ncbi:MAG: PAS domain S-box protein [Proteobacteria bacterium]|nr:PAS domain S-box protein [Pseudomonadota bacterium]
MSWIEGMFDRLTLRQSRGTFGYLIVAALMCTALLVRIAVAPLEAGLQYLTFFPAVALSAILCGFWPGLFAVLIGMCMATFIFVPPYYSISLHSLQVAFWPNMVFLVDGFVVCSAVAAMHRYQDKLNAVNVGSKRARQIIEATSDGFWLCDISGKILDVNSSYCRMTGFTRQELLAMHISDIDANESQEDAFAHIQWVIEHGFDVFETQHRCKGGGLANLEISVSFVKEQENYFIVFARDITERKRIEAEIGKTHAELEDLYNNAPCGYHSLGIDGKIIQVNQTELNWLGYTREEMLGRKIMDFQTPLSAKVFEINYPRFKRDGYILDIEVEMLRKDGTVLPLLLSANTVNDADGNFVMSRTSLIDITDRKRMENELRESESRFRQLFEKAPIGIALGQQDQKFFATNAAFCKMFGYTGEELAHLSIIELTHPDDLDLTRKMLSGLLEGDISEYFIEKKYVRKNGEVFWGRAIATKFAGGDYGSRYTMGMVEDISERVEREAQRLSEVKEQRDVLVREVQHRIKNHLQGVVGLLRQSAIDHPDLVDVINAAVGKIRSIAIIHGLQASTLSEEVSLADLMEHIIDATCARIEYENSLKQPVFLNREEAVPIALVLNELLTNACKHRSANSPAIVRFGTSGDNILITIANHADAGRQAADGQGLNLVRSLLPRKSAHLEIGFVGDVFTAELMLSAPVTISKAGLI